jgi:hypothetical protein
MRLVGTSSRKNTYTHANESYKKSQEEKDL